jgi:hypothetical protein
LAHTPEGDDKGDSFEQLEQHPADTILDQRILHTVTLRDDPAASEGPHH